MLEKEAFFEAFWEDCHAVAKVNIYTGEFTFMKTALSKELQEKLEKQTIEQYFQYMLDEALIHEKDVSTIAALMDLNYMQSEILNYGGRMNITYRKKIQTKENDRNQFVWETLECVYDKHLSEEHPDVFYLWRKTDRERSNMEDALRTLQKEYYQILKMNALEGTYEIIKDYDYGQGFEEGWTNNMSEWFWFLAQNGFVHPDELEMYLEFTNLQTIRAYFNRNTEGLRYQYRSNIQGEFRWVEIELIPSVEFTKEQPYIMIFIKDIHDYHVAELEYTKRLEYQSRYDELTGLRNRHSFSEKTEKMIKNHAQKVGLVFADMNGLKFVNDNFGHYMGDTYICSFAEKLETAFGKHNCFRISGDEFVVIMADQEEKSFEEQCVTFRGLLNEKYDCIASIGYAWQEQPKNIEAMVKQAENQMYQAKKEYYANHPDKERRRRT